MPGHTGHRRSQSGWVASESGGAGSNPDSDAESVSDDEFLDAEGDPVQVKRDEMIRERQYIPLVMSAIQQALRLVKKKTPDACIGAYQAAIEGRKLLLTNAGPDDHTVRIQLIIDILTDAIELENKIAVYLQTPDVPYRQGAVETFIRHLRAGSDEVKIQASSDALINVQKDMADAPCDGFPKKLEAFNAIVELARELIPAKARPLRHIQSAARLEKALRSPTTTDDLIFRWTGESYRPYVFGVLLLSAIAALISIPLAPAMPAVLASVMHAAVWKALLATSVFFYLPGLAFLLDTVRNRKPTTRFWSKVGYALQVLVAAMVMVPAVVMMMPGSMVAMGVKLGVLGMPATGSLGVLYGHALLAGSLMFAGMVAVAQLLGSSLVFVANTLERKRWLGPRATRWLRGVGEAIIVVSPSMLAFGVATAFRPAGQVILQGAHEAWRFSAAEIAQWRAEVYSLLNRAIVPLWEMLGAFVSGVVACGFYQMKDAPIAGEVVQPADVAVVKGKVVGGVVDDYGFSLDGDDNERLEVDDPFAIESRA